MMNENVKPGIHPCAQTVIDSITPRSNGRISISMAYREDTEKLCDTSDEVLEYMVGSDRLRDVITQVTVLDRSI